jgi:hypothetical protein
LQSRHVALCADWQTYLVWLVGLADEGNKQAMADDILSERGRFWLMHDADKMADECALIGHLRIDAHGRTELKIDDIAPMAESWKQITWDTTEFEIFGILGTSRQFVRLERAYPTSARLTSPQAHSIGAIGAFRCFVSSDTYSSISAEGLISKIKIYLGAARAWLNWPMAQSKTQGGALEVTYPEHKARIYDLPDGSLKVHMGQQCETDGARRELRVTEVAFVELTPRTPLNQAEAAQFYFDFENLLLLLTDQAYRLPFPLVTLAASSLEGTLYCTRSGEKPQKFSFYDCWIRLSDVEAKFANIVHNWFYLCDEFGPALHLYFGGRRDTTALTEHRFINLVWGLEALHHKTLSRIPSLKQKQRSQLILETTKNCLNHDGRKWLINALGNALNCTLEDQLLDLFLELPLRIPEQDLRVFAKKCAHHRNALSHYGGTHSRSGYLDFMMEAHHLSDVLDPIYHALLLLRAGVPSTLIQKVFFGPKHFHMRAYFGRVGLQLPQP